ncbi:hypothetical protein Trydic_g23520 [Trypoxylus dichotomus]
MSSPLPLQLPSTSSSPSTPLPLMLSLPPSPPLSAKPSSLPLPLSPSLSPKPRSIQWSLSSLAVPVLLPSSPMPLLTPLQLPSPLASSSPLPVLTRLSPSSLLPSPSLPLPSSSFVFETRDTRLVPFPVGNLRGIRRGVRIGRGEEGRREGRERRQQETEEIAMQRRRYLKGKELIEAAFENVAHLYADKSAHVCETFVHEFVTDFRTVRVLVGRTGLRRTEYALAHFRHPVHVRDDEDLQRLSRSTDNIVLDDLDFSKWLPATFLQLLNVSKRITQNIKYECVRIPARTPRFIITNNLDLLWPRRMHAANEDGMRMTIELVNDPLFDVSATAVVDDRGEAITVSEPIPERVVFVTSTPRLRPLRSDSPVAGPSWLTDEHRNGVALITTSSGTRRKSYRLGGGRFRSRDRRSCCYRRSGTFSIS